MVSLVVGLLYVAACACPAVKEKNRGLELINGLLVSLGAWALLPERTQLLVGSYLWLASLIAFALSALAIWFWEPRKEGSS
jgi:hypothetical protein